MVLAGVVLLSIGVVTWGLGQLLDLPDVLTVIGHVVGAIGGALLAIGVILALVPSSPGPESKGFTMTVIVYSKPGCPQCDATVRTLTNLQKDHPDLEYRKVDMSLEPEAAEIVKSLGYTAAPVVVAGEIHWAGFRPDRIKELVA